MTDLPPGFTPAWEYLRTEDGVVELEHEGGRIAREAMEAIVARTELDQITEENAATVLTIQERIEWLHRAADGSAGRFQRCRAAGNDLAAAIRNLPESEVKTALYPAYEAFMQQDAGNFHEIVPDGS